MTAPEILLADAFARHVAGWARIAGAPAAAGLAASLAARAMSLATSEGHVCIDLSELATAPDGPGDAAAWRSALLASGTTGTQAAPAAFPLILDDDDRLYLQRDFDFERRLADRLVRATGAASALPAAASASLRELLAALFPSAGDSGPDWQKLAAALALQGRLTVISGGPGTGKTTTVVGLLACLLTLDPACRIALAAPTGKAAARMNEALRQRAAALPADLLARLPAAASTVHRLLQAGADGRFRRDAARPLAIDVLVVDEASMLDLALATRLLEAVPDDARIVLLGDKDQLSAVEAGAVFSELSRHPSLSAARIAELSALTGAAAAEIRIASTRQAAAGPAHPEERAERELPDSSASAAARRRVSRANATATGAGAVQADLFELPLAEAPAPTGPPGEVAAPASPLAQAAAPPSRLAEAATSASPLADSVVWLRRNYRFARDSGIGRLADLVNAGAADDALAWLATGADDAVRWWSQTQALPGTATLAALDAGYDDYVQALQADPADRRRATDAFARFRVLCAQREGPRGVAGINAEMTRRLRARIALAPGAEDASPWYVGRPIIVLANDYVLRLFNGDLGLVLPDERGELRVHFADAAAPDGFRAIAPARLPRHDTAFALTVHKAQGSEFDDVLVLLPRHLSRTCTRELLYTAVTRARSHASIVASPEVLAATIATSTRRRTGLLARLDEALAKRSP